MICELCPDSDGFRPAEHFGDTRWGMRHSCTQCHESENDGREESSQQAGVSGPVNSLQFRLADQCGNGGVNCLTVFSKEYLYGY